MATQNAINGDEINGVSFPLTESGYAIINLTCQVTVGDSWAIIIATGGFSSTIDAKATSSANATIQIKPGSTIVASASVTVPITHVRRGMSSDVDASAACSAVIRLNSKPGSTVTAQATTSVELTRHVNLPGGSNTSQATASADFIRNRGMSSSINSEATSSALTNLRVACAGAVSALAEGDAEFVFRRRMGGNTSAQATSSGTIYDYNVAISADDDSILYVPTIEREMRVTA